MPRVHYVKRARKDNPVANAGEPYYWWKFRYGGKHFSKTPPRASQLTQSDKLSRLYEAQEEIEDALSTFQAALENVADIKDREYAKELIENSRDDLKSALEGAASNVREVSDEYNESADNVEEHFPGSPQVDEIREKADGSEQYADEIENVVGDIEEDLEDDEAPADYVERMVNAVEGIGSPDFI